MKAYVPSHIKYVGSTEYKHVKLYKNTKTQGLLYFATVCSIKNNYNMSKFFDTIKEAALCVDMFLINKGKEPVNILKKCLK